MPGRLRTSFRSGNLAEHLGLLLLKGVAAVAEVTRSEDVGLDAIATLLRRDDDGNCYAENSFLVQLKSASTKEIDYQGHELDWLVGQTQPMFIGLVSLDNAQISLYPTLFVNQAVFSLCAKKVAIRFGASDLPTGLIGQKWLPWRGEPDDGASVWLGEPLLEWTLKDLVNKEWVNDSYRILKSFLSVAEREIDLLSFGQFSVLNWTTNDVRSIDSQYGMMKGHPDELKSIAGRLTPGLNKMMLHAMSMGNDSGNEVMLSLIRLATVLRGIDVEIDPLGFFSKLPLALQQSDRDDAT